LKKRSIYWQYY